MKQIISKTAALLSCLALLSAAGCQTADPGAVKDYEDAAQVTLSILTNDSLTEDDLWDAGFTAADGTHLTVVEYSSDYYEKENLSYRELVLKRLQSNVDVDCYIIHAEDVIAFAAQNYWMDLSGLPAVDSLSENARWQSTYEGKVFSLPLAYTGFGFYWNLDMLTAHGLEVPTDITGFLQVCETLKQAGITPYIGNKGYALTVPAMVMGFTGLYAAEDKQELLAALADGATPVSTYMTDGFAFIEMLIQKGYMDPAQALAAAPGKEDRADFLAGKGAFYCGALSTIEDAGFEILLTGIPAPDTGTIAVVGAQHRLAVNPSSENVGYTVELLNSMITPEWLAANAARTQQLSSGRGEYDLSYLPENIRDFARLVQKENQIPNQDFSLTFNTWEAIRDLCREICAGMSAQDAAARYDEIQKEQIAAYHN